MSDDVTIQWHGEAVIRRLRRATAEGINATMTDAVLRAKRSHPWRNRTGFAEGSIRILVPATAATAAIEGVWGSSGVRYMARLEFGFQGVDRAGRLIDQRARPALRPAQQIAVRRLARRIRTAFAQSGR